MSKLLVLISSVIDTPNTPLSYSQIRSVYNRDERFQQTQYTIKTIKHFFPEADMMMVECSNFENHPEQLSYLTSNIKYFINLWDRKELHPNILGLSKALGEGTITIEAFNFLFQNNIQYEHLIKISGRYQFIDRFEYDNDFIITGVNNENNYVTQFYKLPFNYLSLYKDFLINKMDEMINCCCYEGLFKDFCQIHIDKVKTIDNSLYVYGIYAPYGGDLKFKLNI